MASCAVNQLTSGLIIGMFLFCSIGLTLIFGFKCNKFARNFLYGWSYFAFSTYLFTESYLLSAFVGGLGAGIFGIFFERVLISKVYGQDILMQLLVCYAFILITDDLVKLIWGTDYIAMGIPDEFRLAPFRIFGGYVPPLYAFLIILSLVIGILTILLISKTRFGSIVRAAAENSPMVSALGIRVPLYFALLFGLGCALLELQVHSQLLFVAYTEWVLVFWIESFIVTVIGGMGSIPGALIAAIILGLTRSIGSVGFPLFVDGLMFLIMAIVLIFKPTGLFVKGSSK